MSLADGSRYSERLAVCKLQNQEIIEAKGFSIQIFTEDFKNDFLSLTDIAKYRNSDDPRFVVQNWMRNRNTLEYLGIWETLNNPNFNRVQFDTYKSECLKTNSIRAIFT